MNSFWAEIEAQQKLIESNPTLMAVSIVIQVLFIIIGVILARRILKDAKANGGNGMGWAITVFLTWALAGILGLIPVAIYYMTKKQQTTQPQMRNLSGEMIKCPSCNYAKNPPGSDMCGLCGRPLNIVSAEQANTCSGCGDINPTTNKFCRSCGKQL